MRRMRYGGTVWIDDVPEGWNIGRLKSYFTYTKGLNITKSDLTESGIPVISYGQIHAKTNSGVSLKPELLRFVSPDVARESPSAKLDVGDIVFADTSEDYEGLGNCVLVDREGVYAGYHDLVAKAKAPAFSKYFAYLFQTDVWRDQFRSRVGGIKVYSLTQRGLNDVYVLAPPLHVQRKITDYLDSQCAEIERSIADAQVVIQDYLQYKVAAITHAVTYGIGAAEKTLPSELKWVIERPAGWSRTQLSYLCGRGITYGIVKLGDYAVNGVNVIRCSDVKDGYLDLSGMRTVAHELSQEYRRTVLRGGEVLVNVRGTLGGCAVVPSDLAGANIAREVAMLDVMPEKACSRFVMYNLLSNSFKNYVGLEMSGAIYQGLNIATLCRYSFYAPPLKEQKRIADYLDEKCADIEAVVADRENQIAELESYKKSLIFEVVTGKREVA